MAAVTKTLPILQIILRAALGQRHNVIRLSLALPTTDAAALATLPIVSQQHSRAPLLVTLGSIECIALA
jgi:hypothetical protein